MVVLELNKGFHSKQDRVYQQGIRHFEKWKAVKRIAGRQTKNQSKKEADFKTGLKTYMLMLLLMPRR